MEFEEIYAEFQPKILNYLERLTGPNEAEDLAQVVFAKVSRGLPGFKGQSKLSTWIYRITVNKSLDLIRKRRRKKRFGQVLSLSGRGDDEQEIQLPVDGDPHQDLEKKERRRILDKAMGSLPENQRVALTLSKYEGMRHNEIAEIKASLDLEHHSLNEPFFCKKYSKPILLAVIIATFNQLSGINAVLYYAPRIFEMAGFGANSAMLSSTVVGFSMLTLGLITGLVYAKTFWGRFWSWDPKEVWSAITWIFYAVLLHERITVGWRGRKSAIMAIIGFGVLLFTFLGVNLLLEGHHGGFTK